MWVIDFPDDREVERRPKATETLLRRADAQADLLGTHPRVGLASGSARSRRPGMDRVSEPPAHIPWLTPFSGDV
jgi:hypothetical protein